MEMRSTRFLGVTDQRLCRAKREGPNCVIAVQAVAGIVAPEMSVEFLRAGMSPPVTFEVLCNFRDLPTDIAQCLFDETDTEVAARLLERRFDPLWSPPIPPDWLVPNWQYDIVTAASLLSEVVWP
jgi:hypothetical protein